MICRAFGVLLVMTLTCVAQPDGTRQRAPFTDLKATPEGVIVQIDGTWYQWISMDGIPIERIKEGASLVDSNWEKRIAEDLTESLLRIGYEHGDRATLVVVSIDGGEPIALDLAMTRENRDNVRDVRALREAQAHFDRFGAPAAFEELVAVIKEHHAYAALLGVDLDALAAAEVERLGEEPRASDAVLAAQRLVCRLGDGHASIENWRAMAPDGRLDFQLESADGGIVALRRPGAQAHLVADGYPFVVSMDGLPIDVWIDAASAYVTDGSDALVRRRSTDMVRSVNLVRDELGLPHEPTVEVVLRNARAETTSVSVPVVAWSGGRAWPWADDADRERGYMTGRLDGDIGYVRILRMIGDAATLRRDVEALLDTNGIIIDVRGNGGGSRAPLLALMPLFMSDQARVVNVAKRLEPRMAPRPADGWLANRYAFPVDWTGWSEVERETIDAFMAGFEPAWEPGDRFSEWHVMVIARDDQTPRFDGPVVVLMDETCFSATDIFLGALKGMLGVTLLGGPSSGGSARSEYHELTALDRDVRLATMASFQPDGSLYDGHGVQPDVAMSPTVDDLLGRSDSMLQAAMELIGD